MSEILKSPYKFFFLIGLIVFLITSFFSAGYYHVDEHFQILEFANYKLGNSPASDLPWEFHEKIRPALQPAIAFLIIKSLNILCVNNPFTYALVLRIITALISWFVISKISLFLVKDFSTNKGRKLFLFVSFFLWFIPFISVRFSSENYAAITFLGAVYLILRFIDGNANYKPLRLAVAGLLLGFSFFFRFQMGIAILALVLWLLFVNKMNWKYIFILLSSGIIAIAFCMYIDYWFYGEFVFTPFNYFDTNILQNKVASFGVDPWWYYLELYFIKVIPPISIVLLVYFFVGLYKRPTHLFAWLIIPFVLVHFFISHKEIRFLFPMAFYFTYLVAIGIDQFITSRKFVKIVNFFLVVSLLMNILLLVSMAIIPSQMKINYYRFLYNYSAEKETVILCKEKSLFELADSHINFYKSATLQCLILKDDEAISDYLESHQPESVLLLERTFTADINYQGYKNQTIYSAMPGWIVHFNFFDWISRSSIWKIEELKRMEKG